MKGFSFGEVFGRLGQRYVGGTPRLKTYSWVKSQEVILDIRYMFPLSKFGS